MSRYPVIRVVVIDDHEMILQSMVRLLRDDPLIAVVGTALTAQQGIRVTREVQPDIVIIDYSLTDMDAPDAIKLLRMVHPNVKVITFSGAERPGALYASMRAGSSGWVNKTRAIQELRNAVLNVAAGQPVSNQEIESLPPLDQLVLHYQPIATSGKRTSPSLSVHATCGGDRLHRRDRPVGMGAGRASTA
jgi:DNA-binding NarL/FixJ family response regulator